MIILFTIYQIKYYAHILFFVLLFIVFGFFDSFFFYY